MNAPATIVTSLLFAGGVTIARDLTNGHPLSLPKVALGLAGAGIGLSLLAQAAPGIASGFAVLLAIGAAFKAGPATFNTIAARLGAPKPNPTKNL